MITLECVRAGKYLRDFQKDLRDLLHETATLLKHLVDYTRAIGSRSNPSDVKSNRKIFLDI
jgi:hypothetical protein